MIVHQNYGQLNCINTCYFDLLKVAIVDLQSDWDATLTGGSMTYVKEDDFLFFSSTFLLFFCLHSSVLLPWRLSFFCLDAKEPKNQARPDPSGRPGGPAPPQVRLWLFTIGSLSFKWMIKSRLMSRVIRLLRGVASIADFSLRFASFEMTSW